MASYPHLVLEIYYKKLHYLSERSRNPHHRHQYRKWQWRGTLPTLKIFYHSPQEYAPAAGPFPHMGPYIHGRLWR